MELILFSGEKCLIDNDDYEKIKSFKWHKLSVRNGKLLYAQAWNYENDKPHKILLHRLILNCANGEIVDHINGNGLDNRKSNLRIVDGFKNLLNSKKPISNTSGYKNLRFRSDRNTWSVEFSVNKKRVFRKTFKTFHEALAMRDIVQSNLHSFYKCYERALE